jgi:uncharacterized protein YdeI (YjbR/CyaY-like superfamily)
MRACQVRRRGAVTVDAKPAPKAFATAAALRAWFERNHDTKSELWILYPKKGSGRQGVGYPEALDEALCFGWIDGQAKGIDEASYMQRWTPRKATSRWSAVNVRKAEALIAAGRMTPAGRAAFERRGPAQARGYSFKEAPPDLPLWAVPAVKKDGLAWAFWTAQPPGYRRMAVWWVASAVKEDTKARRLSRLVACSRKGQRLPQFVSPAKATRKARGAAKAPPKRAAKA